LPLILKDLK